MAKLQNLDKLVLSIVATLVAVTAWSLVLAGSSNTSRTDANTTYSLWGREDCYERICHTEYTKERKEEKRWWFDEKGEKHERITESVEVVPITTCVVTNYCNITRFDDIVASLNLEMTPPEVVPGLTSSLTLNCSISSSDSFNLMSIILSKGEIERKGTPAVVFTELASVDIFSPNQPRILNKTSATVSSYTGLGLDATYFLALHWVFPSDLESGMYRCQAFGADAKGHPKETTQTSNVMGKPSFSQLMETITLLKVELENQTKEISGMRRQLENQDNKLHDLAAICKCDTNQADTIALLQTKLERQEKKQAQLVSAMFEKSSEYNGHYYLLSKQEYGNIDAAEAVCEHHGGYLVEIDNSAEHEFIRNFLNQFPNHVPSVYVGATDEAEEGVWRFRFSGKRLTYLPWGGDNPNKAAHNCADIFRSYNWNMSDWQCDGRSRQYPHVILCEVQSD